MRVAIRRPLSAAAALATLALGACVGDDQAILNNPNPANGGVLFQRYVALGNSITAGYQSGGILAATEDSAYPRLLAIRASITNFGQPRLAGTGCPQPFTAPLTPSTVTGTSCVRIDSTAYTQNLGVPGVRIADAFVTPNNPTVAFQRLYGLITGGKSEVQAMIDARPTFVSAWLGNNDALSAALGGVLGPTAAGADSTLTRLAAFQASVQALETSIKVSGAQGVALVGVVFADSAAPLLQPGAYFFLSRDAAGKFNGKPVNDNCSPVTALGTPNPLSQNLVSFQVLSSAVPEINCDPANAYGGVYLLDSAERAVLGARVAAYNAAIKAAADRNGWVYVNPMDILRPELARTTTVAGTARFNQIRKCQALNAALATGSAAAIQGAVLTSCPVPPSGPTATFAAPNFFGALISFDGVHPSSAAHVLIARGMATAINAKYGTQLITS